MLKDAPNIPISARQARLFRNGRNQAVRIPREFELPADEVMIYREDDHLVVVPVKRSPTLAAVLSRLIPFQIHNHPRCAFQAAAALTIAQSRLMMDVMRAGCSEKYVHAWSTALRASSTVGKSLFARKFDFK